MCDIGYTLSFDSAEYIPVKACTIGQTILLVVLIILYWIAITVAVFVMMYFKVEIGYLYGITYYFSIVDILLGAIYIVMSNISITGKSKFKFTDNTALQDGGAMFLHKQYEFVLTDDADIIFSLNTASDYGGAVYNRVDQSVINFNTTNIHFDNNHARTAGSSVYINVQTVYNSNCLHNCILGVSEGSLQNNELSKHITTSPRKLELYKPAECINNNNIRCDSY